MKLIIASKNLHKVREYRTMMKQFPKFDLFSLNDFPDYIPPPEDGKTFEEIVSTKAHHAAIALNEWVIADDSGLVIPALNNTPGIHSQRYAGENASDADNRHKLIKELKNLKEHERVGYFVCSIAIASKEGVKKVVTGMCEGTLLIEERGRHGFGYDPLFMKYDYGKTFAELDEDMKNRISHRRKAFDKLLSTLETLAPLCTTS